ncbi:hypothetical protein V2J09_004373 [Rumex salicifolius]
MDAKSEKTRPVADPPVPADDDDEAPTLSPYALQALKEFLTEQNGVASAADTSAAADEEVSLVSEDWRLSQFWYSPDTATAVAEEVLHLCNDGRRPSIACIACPTLFAYLKKMDPDVSAILLEYDKRFEQYGHDFSYYDYNKPEDLPQELKHSYQIIVADPPYLAEIAAELLDARPCGFRPIHSSKLGNEFQLFTNYDPGQRLGGWRSK